MHHNYLKGTSSYLKKQLGYLIIDVNDFINFDNSASASKWNYNIAFAYLCLSRSPLHTENKENVQNNPRHGKHREFGNFAKTQKTQGIWFAQVVNSRILKLKDMGKPTLFALALLGAAIL